MSKLDHEYSLLTEYQKIVFLYIYYSGSIYSRPAPKTELQILTDWYNIVQETNDKKGKALIELIINKYMSIGMEDGNLICRVTEAGRERAKLEQDRIESDL